MDDIRVHKLPKHAPPKEFQRKTELVEDPKKEVKEEIREMRNGTNKSATLELLDINSLTKEGVEDLIKQAKKLVDERILDYAPEVALQSALDQAIWLGEDGQPESSQYELISQQSYLQLLATLADEFDLEVVIPAHNEPFQEEKDHLYSGIDVIQANRINVASVVDDLVNKRDKLRNKIKQIEALLSAVNQTKSDSELEQSELLENLKLVDSQIESEVKKLTNYQEFLKEVLQREVHAIFTKELQTSPLVRIDFGGVASGQGNPQEWVLKFDVTLEEIFDPADDQRFKVDSAGSIFCTDVKAVLADAAAQVKRKLTIIQRSFESFLGSKVEVYSENRIHGRVENKIYKAFSNFTFNLNIPVKSENDVKLITKSIADALKDLMDAEYGRLSSR